MKLLGTPKNEITKYKNEENVPNLENTEVVIVYCYIFIMDTTTFQEL